MNLLNYETPRMSLPVKLICVAAIICCVVIGFIGLVLPIIPGLVFLFIAVVLLTRLSRRINRAVKSHPTLNSWMKYGDSLNSLSISQRIKLSLLFAARTITTSLDVAVNWLSKTRNAG